MDSIVIALPIKMQGGEIFMNGSFLIRGDTEIAAG
jgi:hypothetical protein